MLHGIRSALKFLTMGLLLGLLLAPRKGEETRQLLVDRGKDYIQEVMNVSETNA